MINSSISLGAAGLPATDVQLVDIPIPVDIPLADVLVTTWSDFTVVCCLVYAVGLVIGMAIREYRWRKALREPSAGR